jgi:hypothetical protein
VKKLLLTSIAALFLATGTAHADALLSLTDPLIGNWCEPHAPEDKGLFNRGPECDTVITRDGYGGVEGSCTFLEIKRIRKGIEAFSKCTAENLNKPLFCENVRFQIMASS